MWHVDLDNCILFSSFRLFKIFNGTKLRDTHNNPTSCLQFFIGIFGFQANLNIIYMNGHSKR